MYSTFGLPPSSFLLLQESVEQESTPFDSGGYSSVFKATFKEHTIVIKVLNVAAQAGRGVVRVGALVFGSRK